ncbi:MAG: hypothetical protein L3J79_07580, partial [Candidatus Marinimicrobia bacterium]|nr:hypothetical protein [Candidatus Neomarinimicrobiota bacterium]
ALPVAILTDPQYAYLPVMYICPETTSPGYNTPANIMSTGDLNSDPFMSCQSTTPEHPFRPYD